MPAPPVRTSQSEGLLQPPDAVEEKHPLFVVHQLVVVAGDRFPKDRPHLLLGEVFARICGDQETPLLVLASGEFPLLRGPFLYRVLIIAVLMKLCYTLDVI